MLCVLLASNILLVTASAFPRCRKRKRAGTASGYRIILYCAYSGLFCRYFNTCLCRRCNCIFRQCLDTSARNIYSCPTFCITDLVPGYFCNLRPLITQINSVGFCIGYCITLNQFTGTATRMAFPPTPFSTLSFTIEPYKFSFKEIPFCFGAVI